METKEIITVMKRLLETSNVEEVEKILLKAGPKEKNPILEFLNNLSIYGTDALSKENMIEKDLTNDHNNYSAEEEDEDLLEIKMFASFLYDHLSTIFDKNIDTEEAAAINEEEFLEDIKSNVRIILSDLNDYLKSRSS